MRERPIQESTFLHSPDYGQVTVDGRRFLLTKSQAKAVRALHEAWKRGRSLDHQALLEAADRAPTSQFRDLFRTRPEAFKALIVHKGKGIYRLNLPFPKARTGR